MSPKYWVSSEDLSADSSVEDSVDRSRDQSDDGEERQLDGDSGASTAEGSIDRSLDDRTVARTTGTNVALPRLPNLQSQQHATLFYLSLIEGRCRTQALNTINASRSQDSHVREDHPEVLSLAQHLFSEMKRELQLAGLLPEDIPALGLADLHQYLNSFDNLINNIAAQQTFNPSAEQQHNHRALPGFGTSSFNSQIVPYGPTAFVFPRQAIMAPPTRSHSMLSVLFPQVQSATIDQSIYVRDFEQLSLLGKGGFGKVYKAKNKLDGAEYAIKKIVLTAAHLRRLFDQNKLHRVTNEIKVLARMDHHHVSRYHHCWIESRPSSLRGEDYDESNNDSEFSSSSVPSPSIAALTSGIESIQFGLERDLDRQLTRERRERRATLTEQDLNETFDSSIVFSDSGSEKHPSNSRNSHKADDRDELPEEVRSMFVKPGDDSDSTEEETDDVEEVPRSEVGKLLLQEIGIKEDFVLFIKMTPYPLTLEELIWPDLHTTEKDSMITHCFHSLPAVRLLLAILEGVEYLHRKNIIHRDLKPKNIFLAILDPDEKPTQGYININNCKECSDKKSAKPTFVCPKLGDFGLIYELKHSSPYDPLSSGSSPLVSSNVGTTLYCPPVSSASPAPCPKLDVFSLGVIAFELVYNFKTDTERRVVLTKLGGTGEVPDDFRGHEMREGIEQMVCRDINRRWSTTLVREWLEGLLERWE